MNPPNESERKSPQYLTKQAEFNEHFERLLLRFTDSTYDELVKATPHRALLNYFDDVLATAN